MSAISLKSITGITSITTPAGVDNQLTLHTNNTTERLKIDEAGNVRVANTFDCVGVSTFRNNLFAQADLRISGEIVHISDDNTRIQFPSNDNIAFKTAGNERLRINSSGNARLGGTSDTTDQGYRFTLQGSANATYLQFFDNGTGTTHGSDGSFVGLINQDFYVWNREAKDVVFGSSNNERLRITSGGTIGINDSSPNTYFKLDVNGHTNIVGDIALPTTNRIYFGNSDTAFIKGEHGGSAYLAFGANNEKMRLTRSGYLGIGTDNPSRRLDLHESSSSCLLYTSPSPRDKRQSRMPSSA